jgi:hypothetical protein
MEKLRKKYENICLNILVNIVLFLRVGTRNLKTFVEARTGTGNGTA